MLHAAHLRLAEVRRLLQRVGRLTRDAHSKVELGKSRARPLARPHQFQLGIGSGDFGQRDVQLRFQTGIVKGGRLPHRELPFGHGLLRNLDEALLFQGVVVRLLHAERHERLLRLQSVFQGHGRPLAGFYPMSRPAEVVEVLKQRRRRPDVAEERRSDQSAQTQRPRSP